jgi:hypothetical protein
VDRVLRETIGLRLAALLLSLLFAGLGAHWLRLSLLPEERVSDGVRRAWAGRTRWRRILMTALTAALALGFGGFALLAKESSAAVALPPSSSWTTVTESGARFSAAFPGTPAFSSQQLPSGVLTLDVTELAWRSADGSAGLFVIAYAYPPGALAAQDPATVEDTSLSAMLANTGETLVTSRDLPMCGGVGREFVAGKRGQTATTRECVTGDRLYVVSAANIDAAGTEAFLGSFKVLGP